MCKIISKRKIALYFFLIIQNNDIIKKGKPLK